MENKCLELQFRVVDVDVLVVTEISLQLGEDYNELTALDCSFSEMDKWNGRIRGERVILVQRTKWPQIGCPKHSDSGGHRRKCCLSDLSCRCKRKPRVDASGGSETVQFSHCSN